MQIQLLPQFHSIADLANQIRLLSHLSYIDNIFIIVFMLQNIKAAYLYFFTKIHFLHQDLLNDTFTTSEFMTMIKDCCIRYIMFDANINLLFKIDTLILLYFSPHLFVIGTHNTHNKHITDLMSMYVYIKP